MTLVERLRGQIERGSRDTVILSRSFAVRVADRVEELEEIVGRVLDEEDDAPEDPSQRTMFDEETHGDNG